MYAIGLVGGDDIGSDNSSCGEDGDGDGDSNGDGNGDGSNNRLTAVVMTVAAVLRFSC
jgi:hypothetical protein